MQRKHKISTASVGILLAILIVCNLASLTVIFGRVMSYTEAKFVNVMPINVPYAPAEESSAPEEESTPVVNPAPDTSETTSSATSSEEGTSSDTSSEWTMQAHPEFHMEAEVEIFKFFHDETGKVTVIAAGDRGDKVFAPGTGNLYQFTLANTGDVALDYTLTMEAYVTGTDLWIPVNARVWDHTNHYLVGSADEMPDVMELNTVDEKGVLGAGRYAVYSLEWEWPFEREDENGEISANDVYDTMLGNLAVDQDLVLTIVIRTYAEYDEDPNNPGGVIKPPQTGDEAPLALLAVLCGASFVGLCVMGFAYLRDRRKGKDAESA